MSIVYLNGEFLPLNEAKISVMDRGFLFADGIYEVIPAYQSRLFRFDEHMDRLERSLNEIQIPNPKTREGWRQLFDQLIEKNGGGNLSIYLQITRGIQVPRDHGWPDNLTPTVFASTSPIKPPQTEQLESAAGASAITADDIRWYRCDIKSVSLLPNTLLRQQAQLAGAQEAILLRDDRVTEGAASNVFIVKEGIIKTPPKSQWILGGITRDLIVELAQQHQLPLEETEISRDELLQADEIWLSSSTKELVPVTQLDGKPVGNGEVGPVWRKMARIYLDFKQQLCGEDTQ